MLAAGLTILCNPRL